MILFLDTNILIDLVADRKPFSKWAYKIFEEQKKGKWKLHTTASSILTTYYVAERDVGEKKSRIIINILLKRLEIQSISKSNLITGISSSLSDYEDAVFHESANSLKGVNFIITRNKRDFKNSKIPILSSEELFIDM